MCQCSNRLLNFLFKRLSNQVFNQVDYNKNGKLESLEVEIAILKIYNIINKRLPGWQNPPNRATIQAALKLFDVDGNGVLDKDVRPLTCVRCKHYMGHFTWWILQRL